MGNQFEKHLRGTTGLSSSFIIPTKESSKKKKESSNNRSEHTVGDPVIDSFLKSGDSNNKPRNSSKNNEEKKKTDSRLIIIDGFRNWNYVEPVLEFLRHLDKDTTKIVTLGSRGASSLAYNTARELELEAEEVPANWDEVGKKAGKLQKERLVKMNPSLVVLYHSWIYNSKKTKYTFNMARKNKIPYIIINKESQIYDHGNLSNNLLEDLKNNLDFEIKKD